MGHPVPRMPCDVCPNGFCRQEVVSPIANTGYAALRPSPSSRRDPKSQAESPNIIYEVSELPPRLMSDRGPSAWAHPLEEGAIGFAVFDHGVYGARHLGCDRSVGLASQMGVVSIPRDVSFKLVTEAVGAFENGDLSGHPEGSAEPGVAVFGDSALAAEHAGLDSGEVHAAELQELAVMPEAAQITGLSQNGQGVDRPDPGDGGQQLVVGMIGQKLDGPRLDLIALSNQTAPFGQHEAEHANCVGVRVDRQSHRASCRGVNI